MISSDFILRSNSLRTQNFFTPWYVRVHIFSENIAYVLNEWSLVDVVKKHLPTGSNALCLFLSVSVSATVSVSVSLKKEEEENTIFDKLVFYICNEMFTEIM